jgi:hypothetical protein
MSARAVRRDFIAELAGVGADGPQGAQDTPAHPGWNDIALDDGGVAV